MRRREFIALVGGSAAALPWVAWAQTAPSNSRIVGYLSGRSEDVETSLLAGVRKGLQETGYTEGSNLTLVRRWADGHYERLPDMAAELVNLLKGRCYSYNRWSADGARCDKSHQPNSDRFCKWQRSSYRRLSKKPQPTGWERHRGSCFYHFTRP